MKDMANDVYLEQKRSLGNWASSVSYLIIPFSCINCIIKLCHFLIIMSPQVYMFLLLLNDGRHDDNKLGTYHGHWSLTIGQDDSVGDFVILVWQFGEW